MATTPDKFRLEHDSMGEVRVPLDALYGAQTQRAVDNFPLSGLRLQREFLAALGLIKIAAARANHKLGELPENMAQAIEEDQARLRFFLSSLHKKDQLVKTADILKEELERLTKERDSKSK